MRKNVIISAVCATVAMLSMLSCQKQIPAEPAALDQTETRTLTVSTGADTRINSAGATLRWNTGAEKLAVIARVGGSVVVYQFDKPSGASTPATADFTCSTVSTSAELLYAVYPYSASYDIDGSGNLLLALENSQHQDIINSVSRETLFAGKISGGSVSLKAVCAYLKFTLPERTSSVSGASNITVAATGIAGNIAVDFSGSDPVASSGDADEITFSVKQSKTGPGGQAGTAYVPVLPGTYPSMSITIKYAAADGHDDYLRASASSNTFERNTPYDCGNFSGPYAATVSCSSSVEGSTLSMGGTAEVWKYSGVTNADYGFNFYYKDSEAADDPANWTLVPAASVSGDGTDVTFSATATVDGSKTWNVKAVVTAGGVDKEAGSKRTASVTLTTATASDFANFVYGDAPESGYHKLVDDGGNDIFPNNYPGKKSGSSYKARTWDGSSWGDPETIDISSAEASKITGGTLTKDGYAFYFPSTSAYYSVFSNKFCCKSGYSIQLPCPAEYTITRVRVYVTKNNNINWGLGSSMGAYDVAALAGAKDASNPVEVILAPASPTQGTRYWLTSGVTNNRIEVLTVYYEYD